MRNTIGNNITFTLFGESHGNEIGGVLDGLDAGIKVDNSYIASLLSKRRPNGENETNRIENDEFRIVSGVFNGYTTGAPICIIIKNENVRSSDYEENKDLARPSHADYTANLKYKGFNDYRGGGHFSGRLTAVIVAFGGILLPYLKEKGISIYTHIKEIKGVKDIDLVNEKEDNILEYIDKSSSKNFPVILDIENEMIKKIDEAKKDGDSVGGVCQTVIHGLKAGLGEPVFSSIESLISSAVFSVGGVKGIEFGRGFDFKNLNGSEANDSLDVKEGKVYTKTNNNGGINGGISNGMSIIFNTSIKPTPSIYKNMDTINMKTLEKEVLKLKGRHDPAIIRRVAIVLTSITSLVVADLLKY